MKRECREIRQQFPLLCVQKYGFWQPSEPLCPEEAFFSKASEGMGRPPTTGQVRRPASETSILQPAVNR